MDKLLLCLTLLDFSHGGVFKDKQDALLTFYFSYQPDSCKVSISHFDEPESCKSQRHQTVQMGRKFYKLTRLGQDKVIKFPLQFLPFLNQTIETVALHTSLDPVDSRWLAQLFVFTEIIAKMGKQLFETFSKVNFLHENDYIQAFRIHNIQVKSLQIPHFFSNPAMFFTFTDVIYNKRYLSDDVFVQKRLAGPCPFLIKLITKHGHVGFKWSEIKDRLNPDYNFDSALERAIMKKGITLEKAVDDKILYALYHEENNDLKTIPDYYNSDNNNHTLINVTSPITLFARTSKGKLKVVAIQHDYKKTSAVYSPQSENMLWTMAKAMVNSGDLNACQAIWHLSHIHLSASVYCTIFRSHFSNLHPVYQIMLYHCEGTIPHIALTYSTLVAPHKFGHQLFSISNSGYINLTVAGYKKFKYGTLAYDNLIKAHGLKSKKLKYYPFRDDGKIIWSAFKRFAIAFTNMYYKSDEDVENDKELQSFANQISIDGGKGDAYGGKGNIVGFPHVFKMKDQMQTFITRFLWQIAMHGAVNYPLEPWVSFIPLSPTKLYNGVNTFYHALPDRNTTIGSITFAELLGNMRINRIFDYYKKIEDKRLSKLIRKYHFHFHNCIQKLLERRNMKRKMKKQMGFQYLEPKWLTNSIHI